MGCRGCELWRKPKKIYEEIDEALGDKRAHLQFEKLVQSHDLHAENRPKRFRGKTTTTDIVQLREAFASLADEKFGNGSGDLVKGAGALYSFQGLIGQTVEVFGSIEETIVWNADTYILTGDISVLDRATLTLTDQLFKTF